MSADGEATVAGNDGKLLDRRQNLVAEVTWELTLGTEHEPAPRIGATSRSTRNTGVGTLMIKNGDPKAHGEYPRFTLEIESGSSMPVEVKASEAVGLFTFRVVGEYG